MEKGVGWEKHIQVGGCSWSLKIAAASESLVPAEPKAANIIGLKIVNDIMEMR